MHLAILRWREEGGIIKAIVYHEYGAPEVLRFAEVDDPVPRADEVLVRVMAAGVNPGDWDILHGMPYVLRPITGIRRPKNVVPGLAFAGVVEATGSDGVGVMPGDAVYGETGSGAFAEYAAVNAGALAAMPAGIGFEEAAAVPVCGVTALQALRDVAKVEQGDTLLINGASGGVGTFAVQIGKALGAQVTGVCSGASAELVRAIGADHVIDYAVEDFTDLGRRYDVVLDNVGNRSVADLRRSLSPTGVLIPNSNKGESRWLGSYLKRALGTLALNPFTRQRLRPFAATGSRDDLLVLSAMIEEGAVAPVIDRTFALSEVADALAHYGEGHARGKVIIAVVSNSR